MYYSRGPTFVKSVLISVADCMDGYFQFQLLQQCEMTPRSVRLSDSV